MLKPSTPFIALLLVLGLATRAYADPYFNECSDRTGSNATLIVPSSVVDLNGATMEVDDEIAVFTPSGVCAGHLVWQGTNMALAVWKDDPMTETVEGFAAGEPLTYAVWDASANMEYGRDFGVVNVSYDSGFDADGLFQTDALFLASDISVSDAVGNETGAPTTFALEGNFPNPFTRQTTIRYTLPQASPVKLEVYNLLGHRVGVLVNEERPAGTHEVSFDVNTALSSGVYVYRLQAGDFTSFKKMTLVN